MIVYDSSDVAESALNISKLDYEIPGVETMVLAETVPEPGERNYL
jgi:hypothetical protein